MSGYISQDLGDMLMVVVVDASGTEGGTIVDVNESLCVFTGWLRDELVGQPLDRLVPHPSRVKHHHFEAGFMIPPTEARPMGPDREVFMLLKDGTQTRVWIGLSPRDDKIVVAGIIAMSVGREYGISDPKTAGAAP